MTMKRVEVRRHAETKKGAERERGSLLSGDGVRNARRIGARMRHVERVIVGPDRRHTETAIAMGFAVDDAIDWPSGYVPGVVDHHDQWRWDSPYVEYSARLDASPELRAVTAAHLEHWMLGLERIPDGSALLVVSSGGSIEPVIVAALPHGPLADWGRPLRHLEGATLTFESGRCVDVRIRRRADGP